MSKPNTLSPTSQSQTSQSPKLQRVPVRDPERQRGMRSFLTWAFVLAEVVGKGLVPESAANAAAGEELSFDRTLHDQDAVVSDLSGSNAFRPALLDDLPEGEAYGSWGSHARLPVVQAQDAVLQPEMQRPAAETSTPLIGASDGGGYDGTAEETELVSRPPQNPSAPDPTGSDPTGSDPTGPGPTGSDPTGSDPTGSDPTGSDPTGSGPGGPGPIESD